MKWIDDLKRRRAEMKRTIRKGQHLIAAQAEGIELPFPCRVLVVSDTHYTIDRVLDYLSMHDLLSPVGAKTSDRDDIGAAAEREIVCIWHLGDMTEDAHVLSTLTVLPVYTVRGNCDLAGSDPERMVFRSGPYRALILHGHTAGVKHHLGTLYELAEEQSVQVVCFGHTHVAYQQEREGVLFLNPGTPSQKRRKEDPFSMALLTFDDSGVHSEQIVL